MSYLIHCLVLLARCLLKPIHLSLKKAKHKLRLSETDVTGAHYELL